MSKLYATVSSEKASKGQGGNEFIKLEIKGDNEETLWKINITEYNLDFKGYIMKIWTNDNHYIESKTEKTRGEKQKGEN